MPDFRGLDLRAQLSAERPCFCRHSRLGENETLGNLVQTGPDKPGVLAADRGFFSLLDQHERRHCRCHPAPEWSRAERLDRRLRSQHARRAHAIRPSAHGRLARSLLRARTLVVYCLASPRWASPMSARARRRPSGSTTLTRQAIAKFDAIHRLTEQIAPDQIGLALTPRQPSGGSRRTTKQHPEEVVSVSVE